MVRVAIALGRLGDRATATEMVEWMAAAETNLAKLAALSEAIAQIGDRRSLEPLIRMLQDPSRGPLARAFAAVALGGICDPLPLPWNTPIGADVNYRAAVPTLTDQVSGVLDIL
jgi:HEAT repeat protein